MKDKNKVHWFWNKHGLDKMIWTHATQCLYKWKSKWTHKFWYLSLQWLINFLFPQFGGDKVHKSGHRLCAGSLMLWGAVHMLRAQPNAPAFYSHDISFGTENGPHAGLLSKLGSIPTRDKKLLYSSKHPVRPWGRSSHYSVAARRFYSGYIAIGTLYWPLTSM